MKQSKSNCEWQGRHIYEKRYQQHVSRHSNTFHYMFDIQFSGVFFTDFFFVWVEEKSSKAIIAMNAIYLLNTQRAKKKYTRNKKQITYYPHAKCKTIYEAILYSKDVWFLQCHWVFNVLSCRFITFFRFYCSIYVAVYSDGSQIAYFCWTFTQCHKLWLALTPFRWAETKRKLLWNTLEKRWKKSFFQIG